MKTLGYHGLWEINDCPKELLEFEETVAPLLEKIIGETDLTVLSKSSKQFEPYGVTIVYLLSESHISIHTWPEHRYAAVDLFSCRKFEVEKINAIIKKELKTDNVTCQLIKRGF